MKKRVYGALLAGGLLFTGCTGPDNSNKYEIEATVDEIGKESFHIREENIKVVHAAGSAATRLANGETIHDNYQDSACIGNETSNDFDELIDRGELKVGSRVRVVATVGSSKVECTSSKDGYYQDRSILTSLEIVSQ
jgi:hypothetical protein